MKAMILAAGRGTRMLPLTETLPKALIEVQGITLLEHTIRYLKYFGVNDIVINIHHHARQIVDFIQRNNSFGITISFSDESDLLLDTGGGLFNARWFFTNTEPFILTSSDVITDLDLAELVKFHQQQQALVTLAVKHRKSSRDFLFDNDFQVLGWHNNTTGQTKLITDAAEFQRAAFSTIHVIDPRLFELITERGPFSIIDVYLRLAASHPVKGYVHDSSRWFECGRIENLPVLNQSADIAAIIEKYGK